MSCSSTCVGSGSMKVGNGKFWNPHLSSPSESRFSGYRHVKAFLFFLAILCAGLSLAPASFGYSRKASVSDPPRNASAIAGTVSVTTGSSQANNLAAIAVKMDW